MTETATASPSPSPATTPAARLSTAGASALYIGALLGPSLLLLPGLAARAAGPASLLAWLALLGLSGLIAVVFCALGTRLGSSGGVAGYTAAGLGARAGRAAGWCFLAGVVAGAPVVCLIGGSYAAAAVGADGGTAVRAGLVLLAVVLAVRLVGVRTGAGLQLVLVSALVGLVLFAVLGSAPAARAAHWTPFLPHGWTGVAQAAPPLMFAFVGWEAAASLTTRLRDPRRQLRRVVLIAFAVTSLLCLGLAAATVAVLGPGAGGSVPLADLMRAAIGSRGPLLAAGAALVLTLAATNTYLTGAAALLDALLPSGAAAGRRGSLAVVATTALTGVPLFVLVGTGVLTTSQLVAVPTALFLTVYLTCTAAAVRVLAGPARLAAAVSCPAVLALLLGTGWPVAAAAAVAATAALAPAPTPVPVDRTDDHSPSVRSAPPLEVSPARGV
ncbi:MULTISPECIES: APC family permease [Kitasatospora]|uniref:Putative amino acid transporter n=1 Tax=Kitasatospora setae (strain ATCC 33774 / DSM 43861 / JCM 3304 / KCC A-0304 / NBRC 14216 / KM-6054) TaxID=452652 RepID=E4NJN2_KITSK|nr:MULTISPECIES: APC family permease [Kitasatospora]BAJ33180.1 putative amino acid transporter [Kitasatospora setae KM-6054]